MAILQLPETLYNTCSNSSGSSELPSSIKVTFPPMCGDQAEQLSDCLLGFGAQSVVIEEARNDGQAEQEKFGADAELWDSCQVLVHFPLEVFYMSSIVCPAHLLHK